MENGFDSLLLSQASGKIVNEIPEASGLRFDEILRVALVTPMIKMISEYIERKNSESKQKEKVESNDVPVPTSATHNVNKEIPTAIMLGNSKPLSLKKTVEYIWTGAVVQALECLFSMDKTKKMQMAQYQIFVSRLWSEISRKTGYLNLVNYNNSGNNEEIFDELQKKGLLEEKIFV